MFSGESGSARFINLILECYTRSDGNISTELCRKCNYIYGKMRSARANLWQNAIRASATRSISNHMTAFRFLHPFSWALPIISVPKAHSNEFSVERSEAKTKPNQTETKLFISFAHQSCVCHHNWHLNDGVDAIVWPQATAAATRDMTNFLLIFSCLFLACCCASNIHTARKTSSPSYVRTCAQLRTRIILIISFIFCAVCWRKMWRKKKKRN